MASKSQSNESRLESELQLERDDESGAPSIEKDDEDTVESSPNRDMTTNSQHYFGSSRDGFSITIIENIKEEYGLFVWPSSVILAEYVWQQRSRFCGANVVELGAGTSLPGLVAAKVGANVTLTDDGKKTEVLDNMRQVCNVNDLKCQVLGLTWGVWDAPIFSLHPNIILGADVLYDTRGEIDKFLIHFFVISRFMKSKVFFSWFKAFDDLFATVTFLLQKCPDSVFITTYHNRSGHHLIEFLMDKWCLKCTKLLDGFSFLPPHKASKLSGDIQLAEIVLDTSIP